MSNGVGDLGPKKDHTARNVGIAAAVIAAIAAVGIGLWLSQKAGGTPTPGPSPGPAPAPGTGNLVVFVADGTTTPPTPLENATVTLTPTASGTSTGNKTSFLNLAPGLYTVTASYQGIGTQTTSVNVVANTIQTITFYLGTIPPGQGQFNLNVNVTQWDDNQNKVGYSNDQLAASEGVYGVCLTNPAYGTARLKWFLIDKTDSGDVLLQSGYVPNGGIFTIQDIPCDTDHPKELKFVCTDTAGTPQVYGNPDNGGFRSTIADFVFYPAWSQAGCTSSFNLTIGKTQTGYTSGTPPDHDYYQTPIEYDFYTDISTDMQMQACGLLNIRPEEVNAVSTHNLLQFYSPDGLAEAIQAVVTATVLAQTGDVLYSPTQIGQCTATINVDGPAIPAPVITPEVVHTPGETGSGGAQFQDNYKYSAILPALPSISGSHGQFTQIDRIALRTIGMFDNVGHTLTISYVRIVVGSSWQQKKYPFP